ncbi:MAG: hypothetical protein GEU73_05065 [Chloroflexi bacterium]|nr:hypothetical protein [Chloroflexota bacterium]
MTTREHGTYTRYTWGPDEHDRPGQHCRCEPCRDANRAYERSRKRRKAYGGDYWPWVDAEPVRRHVKGLMCKPTRPGRGGRQGTNRDGIGLKRIARLSGVSHGSLSKLIYGGPGDRPPSRRVHKDTAERLFALKGDEYADGVKVPAGPTWEMADEIIAWYNAEIGTVCKRGGIRHYGGKQWLAQHLTGNPKTTGLQLSERFVSVAYARKIKALHDGLFREHESFRWRHCEHGDSEIERAS